MKHHQTATVIREAIKQAARECGVVPSRAHLPPERDREGKAARDIAIRLAFDQGIPRCDLAEAFQRTRRTITAALSLSTP